MTCISNKLPDVLGERVLPNFSPWGERGGVWLFMRPLPFGEWGVGIAWTNVGAGGEPRVGPGLLISLSN